MPPGFVTINHVIKCVSHIWCDCLHPEICVLISLLIKFVFCHNWIWVGFLIDIGGGEITQSLASLSVTRAVRVRARLNPLVSERWNSITVLLTRSHQCRPLVKKKAVHVLLCLCYNARKKFLAICRKSRALCRMSRLLSVPIWPACVKQGRWYNSNKQTNDKFLTCLYL